MRPGVAKGPPGLGSRDCSKVPVDMASGQWDRGRSNLQPSRNLSKVNDSTPGDGHGQVVGVRWWPRPMGGGKKQPAANAPSPDKEEAEELRRILQSDDIASVDYESYGRAPVRSSNVP